VVERRGARRRRWISGEDRAPRERDFYWDPQNDGRGGRQPFYRRGPHDGGRPSPLHHSGRQSGRDERYVKPPQRTDFRPQTRWIQSDDPDFLIKVRIIYRLIRAVHHINNISQEEYPPSLMNMSQRLAHSIKPAIPNAKTQALIQENADKWARTTRLILLDHYDGIMDEEAERLFQFPIQDWRAPFEIASSWATRNLGQRLEEDTLDHARIIIETKLAHFTSTVGVPEPLNAAEVTTPCTDTDIPIVVEQRTRFHTPSTTQQSHRDQGISITTHANAGIPTTVERRTHLHSSTAIPLSSRDQSIIETQLKEIHLTPTAESPQHRELEMGPTLQPEGAEIANKCIDAGIPSTARRLTYPHPGPATQEDHDDQGTSMGYRTGERPGFQPSPTSHHKLIPISVRKLRARIQNTKNTGLRKHNSQ